MKKYFMSGARGKVHCSIYANGTCCRRIHSENLKDFDSLEEIKLVMEKPASKCKICMRGADEVNEWNQVFVK